MAATIDEKIALIRNVLVDADKQGAGTFRFSDLDVYIALLNDKQTSDIGSSTNDKTLRIVTGTDTVLSSDEVILLNSGIAFNLTMPNPSDFFNSETNKVKLLTFRNIGEGTVTLLPNDGEVLEETTLGGGESPESLTFITNGIDWFAIEF